MPINRGMDKDVVHKYNEILLSYKKEKKVPFAEMWIALEIVIQSEVSKKNKYIILLICGIQENGIDNLMEKQKQRY